METEPQLPDARPKRVLRGRRAALALLVAITLPVVAGVALWAYAEEHRVLPGIGGCEHVRTRTAQLDCYSAEFERVADRDGLQDALRDVDERAESNVTVGSDCHVAWHPVGERDGAADARRDRGYDNIAARTTCQQGYSHGYTIGFMSVRDPSIEELVRIVGDECGGSTGLNALFNCTHAYGHVIARRFDGDAERGIEACSRVDYAALPGADVPSPVPGERPPVLVGAEHQCLYGLYMELAILDLADDDDTLDNCGTATTAAARKACYAYLPARVNAIEGDLAAAGRSCNELAPAGDLRDSCVKTFSMGLPTVERCSLLVAEVEQDQCRTVIEIRDNQEDLLAFADGDPDSFDANVSIAPEPGSEPPVDELPEAPAPSTKS